MNLSALRPLLGELTARPSTQLSLESGLESGLSWVEALSHYGCDEDWDTDQVVDTRCPVLSLPCLYRQSVGWRLLTEHSYIFMYIRAHTREVSPRILMLGYSLLSGLL